MKNKHLIFALAFSGSMAIAQNSQNFSLLMSSGEVQLTPNTEQLSRLS
jgi:hypothetical protein